VRYAALVTVVVGRWWNGRYGRLARRDVRLSVSAGHWTVDIAEGGTEGRSASWEFDDETEARALVAWCLETGGDGWRQLSA
jgi:hypothetical protein